MSSPSPQPTESIVISPEQLAQLELQYPGLSETMRQFQQQASEAQMATPDKAETTTEAINYEALKTEHAELIKQGKTPLEIAIWIGDKLNIASWKAGAFHGERKVLSTPTGEEMTRLQKLTQALGISWSKANGGSNNHADFLLLDGYVQNALFGQANMTQVNERLDTFHTDWKNMGTDFVAKEEYLLEKVGLTIKGDWSKLTGIRYDYGDFGYSGVLYASGTLDGDDVHRMFLDQHVSDVYLGGASGARLCFLA